MKTLTKILIDMIPVILGILIALFINNWKESADNQRFKYKTLNYIKQELQGNREELTEAINQQETLVDTIQVYANDDLVSLVETIMKADGIKVSSIYNTSWKAFQNTKIELIDFEIISLLTNLEELKQLLNLKFSKLTDFVYTHAKSISSDKKEILTLLVSDLVETEKSILKNQEKFFEILEE